MNNLQDKKDEMEGTMNWLYRLLGMSVIIMLIMGAVIYLVLGYLGLKALFITCLIFIGVSLMVTSMAWIFKTISDIYEKYDK